MRSSLYIHIPFCVSKCNYCSFNSYAGLERLQERYVDALTLECQTVAPGGQTTSLATVFLGGGTPSILSNEQLKRLFRSISQNFVIATDTEISIEANPGTIDREKLDTLLQCGVNRLSIGVQSFNDTELRAVSRIHTAQEALLAIEQAKAAGFSNMSIDLMYGLCGQTADSWRKSLEIAISLSGQHLSLYQLTVEDGTPLAIMIGTGKTQLPDEDAVADMDEITNSLLKRSAFEQYEISNYARNGYQCQHNINYWQNGDYYGVGSGAVSYGHGSRIKNITNPARYCELQENNQSTHTEEECLRCEESFRETVIIGLRMNQGVFVENVEKRYNLTFEHVYGEIIVDLIARDLLVWESGFVYLTAKGRLFANQVMAELV